MEEAGQMLQKNKTSAEQCEKYKKEQVRLLIGRARGPGGLKTLPTNSLTVFWKPFPCLPQGRFRVQPGAGFLGNLAQPIPDP
jgi:hypothetical protein